MLSAENNEKMCRVGPGTPMGTALRRYWTPFATCDEVTVDGDPLDVEILGEHFVAFRNSEGKLGLLDEHCCHRGASLLLGRVESCGIRCIYHGWLFAPDGAVLETPNVQEDSFKTRIRQGSYPVREAGGMIWGYFGEEAEPPPFPDLPFMRLPPENVRVLVNISDGNFVQVLEGLLDSTHLGVLHSGNLKKLLASGKQREQGKVFLQDLAPSFESEDTDYGLRYAALRNIPDENGGSHTVARVTAWVAPYFILNPSGGISSIPVPVSDGVTAFFHVNWNDYGPYVDNDDAREMRARYFTRRQDYRGPDRPNRLNRWHQDRESMRSGESFSGFEGLIQDDVAVFGSGGPVRSRTKEHLTHADLAIARLYRRFLEMADSVQQGEDPLGLRVLGDLSHALAYHADLEPGEAWQTKRPSRRVAQPVPVE